MGNSSSPEGKIINLQKEYLHLYLNERRDYPLAIRYKEFQARDEDGLEKRLGILGEAHFATNMESIIAEKIIHSYTAFAIEGATKMPNFFKFFSLAFAPALLTYAFATERTAPPANSLAKKYASSHFYPKFSLEDHDSSLFSFSQYSAMLLVAVVASVMSPYTFYSLKKHGDPLLPGTPAYEKSMQKKKSGKKSILERISDYGTHQNFPQRDQRMADRTQEIFQQEKSGDLLVIVGKNHLDGVVENLSQRISLKEVLSYP